MAISISFDMAFYFLSGFCGLFILFMLSYFFPLIKEAYYQERTSFTIAYSQYKIWTCRFVLMILILMGIYFYLLSFHDERVPKNYVFVFVNSVLAIYSVTFYDNHLRSLWIFILSTWRSKALYYVTAFFLLVLPNSVLPYFVYDYLFGDGIASPISYYTIVLMTISNSSLSTIGCVESEISRRERTWRVTLILFTIFFNLLAYFSLEKGSIALSDPVYAFCVFLVIFFAFHFYGSNNDMIYRKEESPRLLSFDEEKVLQFLRSIVTKNSSRDTVLEVDARKVQIIAEGNFIEEVDEEETISASFFRSDEWAVIFQKVEKFWFLEGKVERKKEIYLLREWYEERSFFTEVSVFFCRCLGRNRQSSIVMDEIVLEENQGQEQGQLHHEVIELDDFVKKDEKIELEGTE